jgi:hypothetical protein
MTAHYFKLDRDTPDANGEYIHERQVKVELVQAICGNSKPLYGVFLDRFVHSETLQIVLTTATGLRGRVTILTNGFIGG